MSESLEGNNQEAFNPDLILEQAKENMEIQPTPISTDPEFYENLVYRGESRKDHIWEGHADDLTRLNIPNFDIALQEFNKFTTETDNQKVMQFRSDKEDLYVYCPNTELFIVVRDRPRKKQHNPPPPSYVVTAYIRERMSIARNLSGLTTVGKRMRPNRIQ